MTVTYSDTLATDRDKVRFYIGDTIVNEGKRPNHNNFSDSEIAFALSESGSGIAATVSLLFETLANEWANYAISEGEGEANFDAKGVAAEYRTQAERWKKKALGTQGFSSVAGSYQPARIDGWNTGT